MAERRFVMAPLQRHRPGSGAGRLGGTGGRTGHAAGRTRGPRWRSMTRSTPSVRTLDASRARGLRVGLVPTMGALHAGHVSLIERAAEDNDVSRSDHLRQPAPVRGRRGPCCVPARLSTAIWASPSGAGGTHVFAPSVEEMYPEPVPTTVVGGRRGRRRWRRRAGRPTSPASPPWWPSCSPSPARAGPTSARRTSSSSPSCAAWPPTCRSRSRSSAARPCASPTVWRCRAATCTSRAEQRAAAPVLHAGAAGRRRRSWSAANGTRRSCERLVAELVNGRAAGRARLRRGGRRGDARADRSAGRRAAPARRRPLRPDPIDRQRRCPGSDEERGQDPACAATPGESPDAPTDDEVEDPPRHGDRRRPALRRIDHHRPAPDGAADLLEYEQVAVVDIDNGARLETYVIAGPRGWRGHLPERRRGPAGGAWRRVIIISYADYAEAELEDYEPKVVHVDASNQLIDAQTAAALASLDRPAPRRYVDASSVRSELSSPTAHRPTGSEHGDTPMAKTELDLLVLGSGVAGLSAAVRAAEAHRMRVGVLTKGALAAVDDPMGSGRRGRGVEPRSRLDRSPPRRHAGRGRGAVRPRSRAGAGRRGTASGPGVDRARARCSTGTSTASSNWPVKAAIRLARVVHAGGSATGAEVERALVHAVQSTIAAIHEHAFALDLIVEGGRCRGVVGHLRGRLPAAGASHQRAGHDRRRGPDVRRDDEPGRGHWRRHRDGASGRGGGRRSRVHPVPPDRAAPRGHAAALAVRSSPGSRCAPARHERRAVRRRDAAP